MINTLWKYSSESDARILAYCLMDNHLHLLIRAADGAAMFVRGSVVIPQYEVDEQIRLVGYGTWPTNNFQSVWWRSNATIYVNILVED